MLTVTCPDSPEVHWIVQTVLGDWLGLDYQCRPGEEVSLAMDGRELKVASDFFNEPRLVSGPLQDWRPSDSGLDARLVESTIPVLFGHSGFKVDQSGQATLCLDVFGSAYFLLSRVEEVWSSERDVHDRFPFTASVAFREGFVHRPLVDEYVNILWAAIQCLWPHLQRRPQRYRLVLSHDADAPAKFQFTSHGMFGRRLASELLKRRSWQGALTAVRSRFWTQGRLHPKDPYNSFDFIMDSVEQVGARSSFYFICGRTSPRHDGDYEIEHPAMLDLLSRIHARGHSIGLHPSYGAYRHPDVIESEFSRLRAACASAGVTQTEWGARMHYLRWSTPDTAIALADAGVDYDTSLGYAEQPGFRCGTCRDYRAFDPVRSRALPLVIRPLIAMDASFLEAKYLGLGTGEDSLAAMLRLRDACRAVDGSFTVLWHNSRLVTQQERALFLRVVNS